MKKLLSLLFALGSISAFSQTFTGGKAELGTTFKFKITGENKQQILHNTKYFSVDSNKNISSLNCVDDETITYKNSLGRELEFIFDDEQKCSVVEACLNDMGEGDKIEIEVNRDDKYILNVNLPLSCSQDAWASLYEIFNEGELI